jgi:hypothetical protein
VAELTLSLGCENVAAVSWRTRGNTTTAGPAAYLLRAASLLQRLHRYHREVFFLPGPANVLVDIASRQFHLSDQQLLLLFNRIAPQDRPWELHFLLSDMNLMLTSAMDPVPPNGWHG